MNKYLTKLSETVTLTPEEAAILQHHHAVKPLRDLKLRGGAIGGIGGVLSGAAIGGIAGGALGLIPALRPIRRHLALGGAALGAGGLAYAGAKAGIDQAQKIHEDSKNKHEAWGAIREAVGFDPVMGTIEHPHPHPLTLQQRITLNSKTYLRDPHEEALNSAIQENPDTGEEYFDREEYYQKFREIEEHNKKVKAFRQKLGLDKTASLMRILGSKGFVSKLKGNLASRATPGAGGEIAGGRPLFPSMGKRTTPGGGRVFQKPMGESQFRFAKPQLIERAKMLESVGTHKKLNQKTARPFLKNTQGMSELIAKAESPKALLRSAQMQDARNRAIFRAKQAPTGVFKGISTNNAPSNSF